MFIPSLVIDTNIFVAAGFRAQSASHRIISAVGEGRLRLVWNDATRTETMGVLRTIPPLEASEFSDLFTDAGRYDGPTTPDQFAEVSDEADRKFAALAAATGVCLVTNDDDLLGPRHRLPIAVLRPSEFLDVSPPP